MSPTAITAMLNEVRGELPEDDELSGALGNPEAIAALMRKPGSTLAGAATRVFTGELLRQSWLLLLPSWGLTLLYLNAHAIIRGMTGNRALAPLGSEWSMWRRVIGLPSFMLKYAEIITIGTLDLLLVVVLLLALAIVAAVVWAITNPAKAAVLFGQEIVNLFR